MNRILVVGAPRSGTSWVEQTMRAAPGTGGVGEPDNEDNFPFALKAKRGLGRYPVVCPDAAPPSQYVQLWEGAFRGGRHPLAPPHLTALALHRLAKQRTSVEGRAAWSATRQRMLEMSAALSGPCAPRRADTIVVKSVFATFALPWICETWAPRLVLTTRSPLNIVASWRRLGWERPFANHPLLADDPAPVLQQIAPRLLLPPLPDLSDSLGRLTWELGAITAMLHEVARRRPGTLILRHEELCADPFGRFRELFERLGLRWSSSVERYLTGRDRPGSRPYDTARIAAEEPTRWQATLRDPEVTHITDVAAGFGSPW
jgi:hypothetical protein